VIENNSAVNKTKLKFSLVNLLKITGFVVLLCIELSILIFFYDHISNLSHYLSDISSSSNKLNPNTQARSNKNNTTKTRSELTSQNHATAASNLGSSSVATPVVVPSPKSSVLGLIPSNSISSTSGDVASDYNSSNWAGYMSTKGYFSGITATWTVPLAFGNNGHISGDATWIGIGGITSSDLIQVGTQNSVSANGQVSSSAFYEILPAGPQTISSITITPGSTITVSISKAEPNLWSVTTTNQSNGETYNIYLLYQSSGSSAEWIEEDPTVTSGQLLPLDDFGKVSFSAGSVTVNGSFNDLTDSNAQPISMVNQSKLILAKPTNINNSGSGFTVTWL